MPTEWKTAVDKSMARVFPVHGVVDADRVALADMAAQVNGMLQYSNVRPALRADRSQRELDLYASGVRDTLLWLAEGRTDSRELTALILPATSL